MYSSTSGGYNSANGYQALFSNKANNRSTAVGYGAMREADDRTTGRETYNTAVGYEALYGSNTPASNTGQYNTALGDQSLFSNSSGYYNTASGFNALYSNTIGICNTALGPKALYLNTASGYNIAIGYCALENQTFPNSGTVTIVTILLSDSNRCIPTIPSILPQARTMSPSGTAQCMTTLPVTLIQLSGIVH